jgi:hypothetical protein
VTDKHGGLGRAGIEKETPMNRSQKQMLAILVIAVVVAVAVYWIW